MVQLRNDSFPWEIFGPFDSNNLVFVCLLDLLQQLSFKKDFRVMGYCSQDTGEISGSLLGRRCGRGMVSKCFVWVLSPVAAGIIGVRETRF